MATHLDDTSTQGATLDLIADDSVFDDDDEHDRLTSELEKILARRPKRAEPGMRARLPPHGSSADFEDPASVSPSGRRAFASALRLDEAISAELPVDGRLDEVDTERLINGRPSLEGSAHWMRRARRRRIYDGLRQAGSWIATVVIGTAIVIAAASFLFNTPNDVKAWQDYGARALKTSLARPGLPQADVHRKDVLGEGDKLQDRL